MQFNLFAEQQQCPFFLLCFLKYTKRPRKTSISSSFLINTILIPSQLLDEWKKFRLKNQKRDRWWRCTSTMDGWEKKTFEWIGNFPSAYCYQHFPCDEIRGWTVSCSIMAINICIQKRYTIHHSRLNITDFHSSVITLCIQ